MARRRGGEGAKVRLGRSLAPRRSRGDDRRPVGPAHRLPARQQAPLRSLPPPADLAPWRRRLRPFRRRPREPARPGVRRRLVRRILRLAEARTKPSRSCAWRSGAEATPGWWSPPRPSRRKPSARLMAQPGVVTHRMADGSDNAENLAPTFLDYLHIRIWRDELGGAGAGGAWWWTMPKERCGGQPTSNRCRAAPVRRASTGWWWRSIRP